MGDSGNASPAFAIASIAGGSKAPSGSSSKEDPAATPSGTPSPTSSFESPPFTGSAITGGASADTATSVSAPTSAPQPTATASSLSAPSTVAPPTASQVGTAEPASASPTTNAAWSIYSAKLWSVIAAPLAIFMLI